MIETRPQVFISYAITEVDPNWLREFASSLQHLGISPAYADGIRRVGDEWVDSLESAFRTSDLVVLIMTKPLTSQANLLFELGAVIGMGKRLVIVAPPNAELDKLPFTVRSAERVALQDSPGDVAQAVAALALAA